MSKGIMKWAGILLCGISVSLGTGEVQSQALASPATAEELAPFPPSLTLAKLDQIQPGKDAATTGPIIVLYPPVMDPEIEKVAPRAGELARILFRHHLSVSKPGQKFFEVVPRWVACWPYNGTVTDLEVLPPQDKLKRDAAGIGAQWMVQLFIRGKMESGQIELWITPLPNGEKQSTVHQWSGGDFFGAATSVLTAMGKAAGWTEEEIKSSGLLDGALSPEAWRELSMSNGRALIDAYDKLGSSSPVESVVTIMAVEYGPSFNLEKINALIQKAPWDYRLVLSKSKALRDRFDRPAAGFLLLRALNRISPNNLVVRGDITLNSESAFSNREHHSVEPTPEMEAVGREVSKYAKQRKGDWSAHLMAAITWKNLATATRGGQVASEVSEASFKKHNQWSQYSVDHLLEVRQILGDDYPRLFNYLVSVGQGQYGGPSLQELVELAYKAEPGNPQTAMNVAYFNSIGWGDQRVYERMIRKAFEKHKSDPAALSWVLESVGMNFYRLPSFVEAEPRELYLNPNGLGPATLEILKTSYQNHPTSLSITASKQMHDLAKAHGEDALARHIMMSNANVDLVNEYLRPLIEGNSQDWAAIEPLARRSTEALSVAKAQGESRPAVLGRLELVRYAHIRSLWKLARTREALEAAERGIRETPEHYMNYYMFAVIADGKGLRKEDTYRCALMAVRLEPSNESAKKLYLSICKKQGKTSEVPGLQ